MNETEWTDPFRDDTDHRSGGCRYQWRLICDNGESSTSSSESNDGGDMSEQQEIDDINEELKTGENLILKLSRLSTMHITCSPMTVKRGISCVCDFCLVGMCPVQVQGPKHLRKFNLPLFHLYVCYVFYLQ